MRKVPKAQYDNICELAEDLEAIDSQIESKVSEINDQIAAILADGRDELLSLIEQRKEIHASLADEVGDVAHSVESYLVSRSEAWHQTDAGERFNEWSGDWNTAQMAIGQAEPVTLLIDSDFESEAFGYIEIDASDDAIVIPERAV